MKNRFLRKKTVVSQFLCFKTSFRVGSFDVQPSPPPPPISKAARQIRLFQNKRGRDEDIHSVRMAETFKYDTYSDDLYAKLRKDQYKFTLDQAHQDAENLYLDDLNIINIENESTLHRVPRLAHGLDHIIHKPGIYTVKEIGKLIKDGGKYLEKVISPDEIEMSKIPEYIPPSRDPLLLKFAKEAKIKYIMSTSKIIDFFLLNFQSH